MKENSNNIVLGILTGVVPVGSFLGICALFGFSDTGIKVGAVIGGLLLIYFFTKIMVKDIKRTKEQMRKQPDRIVGNQPHSLNYQPISLPVDAIFEYPGMRNSISAYIQNQPNALVSVFVDGVVVMQFLNLAQSSTDGQTNITLYFFPKAFSNAHYQRFRANPYIADFNEASDNTFMASYGTDINKAVKVASYILASVYYVPLHATLEYSYETCS